MQIQKYGAALKPTAKQSGEGYCFAPRYVGVVDKVTLGGIKPCPAIVVMFLADIDEKPAYITEKYVVAYDGVFCDDKEQFNPGGTVVLNSIAKNNAVGQSGGFTVLPYADAKSTGNGGFTVPSSNVQSTCGFAVPSREKEGGFTVGQ